MQLFADRFLVGGHDAVDLATGELVRLSIDGFADRERTQTRAALCDRLASIRHPLLLPLVDYGVAQGRWFEAHVPRPALRVPRTMARRTALHLNRFLNAAGMAMTSKDVDRNVRPAIDGGTTAWRPVGVTLAARPSLETILAALESNGPPGVVRIEVRGEHGAGLRTMRLAIARAARLAGFVPLDRTLAARWDQVPALCRSRHLCVIDWSADEPGAPGVLAEAAASGGARHVWLRLLRSPRSHEAVLLEPFTIARLCAIVRVDEEEGPGADDVRTAARTADGLPGRLIEALSAPGGTRSPMRLHETAPEYVTPRAMAAGIVTTPMLPDAGVARLERVASAARTLVARGRHARAERLLRRAAEALAARHALRGAALAACDLGELQLGRCRPDAALESFARARAWCNEAIVTTRVLLGSGRAMLDVGRLIEAEAAFRTVLAAPGSGEEEADARRLLAETLAVRGDVDAAEDVLAMDTACSTRTLALGSEIARRRGDLGRAGRLAADALMRAAPGDHLGTCHAHLAAMHVQAALRNGVEVDRQARSARVAARATKLPQLALKTAAEACGCRASCGFPSHPARQARLLSIAGRLPLLRAAQIRAAVCGIDSEVRRVASRIGALSLVEPNGHQRSAVDMLETLLAVTHEAPDEGTALRGVAEHLVETLGACSITIRAADSRRQVAAAGRPWSHDTSVAERALDGGAGVLRDGPAPEAAEPVRAGGSTIGCIAARWVSGTRPAGIRITESLRLAAAAAAPILRCFTAHAPEPPGPHPDDVLGPGPAAEKVREAIRRAAGAPYPVLIEGESGAGKEIVARAIHTRGLRRARRFCAINCAALTDDLLEAELFGHARGAFTGALVERAGLFEEADQGTLFLDEVGELSPRAQAKLLRVLQEGEVRRVGENHSRRVDARLVAATNRSLEAEVAAGRFRGDLRFRLDVIRISIPPLRERPDDVPWLASTLWVEAARRVGTKAMLSPDLISALARYDWPGNVRELQNVIASLAVHAPRRGRVGPSLLPPHVAGIVARATTSFDEARDEFERRYVRAALARAGGRKAQAARQLGVSRQGLAKMMKRLGVADSTI